MDLVVDEVAAAAQRHLPIHQDHTPEEPLLVEVEIRNLITQHPHLEMRLLFTALQI